MKKTDKRILKLYGRLLAGLLFILGVGTSCNEAAEYGAPVAEYGAPYALYKIKGNIKSDSTNNNIAHIVIKTLNDSTYSDSLGNYQLQINSYPADQSFIVHFIDSDGNLNGVFKNKDSVATFSNAQYINGDGNFYEGETSTQLNVKLKPE